MFRSHIMMQALITPALFFLVRGFSVRNPRQHQFRMCIFPRKSGLIVLLAGYLWSASITFGQQLKAASPPQSALSPEKALALAEQGRCRESIPALKRALA